MFLYSTKMTDIAPTNQILVKTFTEQYSNLDTTHSERLTVVWAILLVRQYLESAGFTPRTHRYTLRWTLNATDWTGKLARWKLRITDLGFEIPHVAEIKHQIANVLSRLPRKRFRTYHFWRSHTVPGCNSIKQADHYFSKNLYNWRFSLGNKLRLREWLANTSRIHRVEKSKYLLQPGLKLYRLTQHRLHIW